MLKFLHTSNDDRRSYTDIFINTEVNGASAWTEDDEAIVVYARVDYHGRMFYLKLLGGGYDTGYKFNNSEIRQIKNHIEKEFNTLITLDLH